MQFVYCSGEATFWFDESKIPLWKFRALVEGNAITRYIGYLHREDGPAFEATLGEEWYLNGKHHRIGGPADVYYKEKMDDASDVKDGYYLWGERYAEEDYAEAMKYLEENGMEAFKLRYS